MTDSPGLLVVISGPSGVGKDSLIERLVKRDPRIRASVSFTTRAPREYEVPDVHYTFLSKPRFEELIGRGELIEWAVYNGCYYGTGKARVEKLQRDGFDVILKIEVRGAEQVREQRPDGLFIFLSPPSLEALLERREHRASESDADVASRQRIARWEMSHAQFYDYVVVNDDLDQAVTDVLAIITQERAKRGVSRSSSQPENAHAD